MKIEKTELKIGCFVPGCRKMATYGVDFGGGSRAYICEDCALSLKSALEGVASAGVRGGRNAR